MEEIGAMHKGQGILPVELFLESIKKQAEKK
jgi:hypothetical protein